MLMPSVSVMSTQMLRSWPKQVQNGSRGRNPSRVITPHASTVPTTARGRSAAIFSPQPSGAGCPSTQRRSHGIVSDTSTVMPAAWTSALCAVRSEEHTSELQSHVNLVCRLLLEKKKIYMSNEPLPKKKKHQKQSH